MSKNQIKFKNNVRQAKSTKQTFHNYVHLRQEVASIVATYDLPGEEISTGARIIGPIPFKTLRVTFITAGSERHHRSGALR